MTIYKRPEYALSSMEEVNDGDLVYFAMCSHEKGYYKGSIQPVTFRRRYKSTFDWSIYFAETNAHGWFAFDNYFHAYAYSLKREERMSEPNEVQTA